MVAKSIQRPKGGVELRKGWTVSSDLPCIFCRQPAMLLDPQGNAAHPGCVDEAKIRAKREKR